MKYDLHKIKPAIIKYDLRTDYLLTCPKCRDYGHKMARKFYSEHSHVEIDYCHQCKVIWFNKNELEVLQFLFEQEAKSV